MIVYLQSTPTASFDALALVLRPATPDDDTFLLKLYATTREDELALTAWDNAAKDAFVRIQYAAQKSHYAQHYPGALHSVVLAGDEPIGMTWVASWPTEIRIMDMAMLPEWRNRGIGTQLVRRVLNHAAALHVPVSAHVWNGNLRASRLYARLGFASVHDDGAYTRMECPLPAHP